MKKIFCARPLKEKEIFAGFAGHRPRRSRSATLRGRQAPSRWAGSAPVRAQIVAQKRFERRSVIATSQVYLGIIVHNGESYEGGFPAIVSRATFEKVQEVLKNRAKPHHSKKRHNFPFTGLLTCGECGAAITAQYAHGRGGAYKYCRCTKRLGSCSQSYLREDLLTEQLKTEISKVAICEDWKEKMLTQVEVWEKENIQSSQSFAQNLEKGIKETEVKLDRLVNAFLDGTIEKDTYLVKKDELVKTKTALLEKKGDFGRKGNNWVEPLRDWIKTAHHAEKLASSAEI